MIELTETQCHALAASRESPPSILDPIANAVYVLLRREEYDRLKRLADEDDARVMAPLLADLDPKDWEAAA
jgi:hypothetical protein